MNLLNRKGSRDPGLDAVAEPVAVGSGKNAPTPRRSDARAARAQAVKAAPATRKERSQQMRRARIEAMEAMKETDPAKLPAAERRPELIYTRDLVDSRRSLAGAFMPVAAVFVLLSFAAPAGTVLGLLILMAAAIFMILLLIDLSLFSVRLERRVRTRFPDSTASVKWYAARRAASIKRLRRPVPRPIPDQNRWGYDGS